REKKPRPGRPNVAIRSRLSHLLSSANRLRKILGKVPANDVSLRINEASIEMTLEHHQHATDRGIRRSGWRKCLKRHCREGFAQQAASRHEHRQSDKISPLHLTSIWRYDSNYIARNRFERLPTVDLRNNSCRRKRGNLRSR